jgi:hypothetical protein
MLQGRRRDRALLVLGAALHKALRMLLLLEMLLMLCLL